MACNSGLFLSSKRSAQTPDGPDDWFTISGRARGGDSGGGVFNQAGNLVGVLWGTDGQEVVCVQAGRLHKLLDQAVVQEDAAQQKSILERVPTPAKPAASGCCPGGDCAAVDVSVAASKKGPLLPWRKETKSRDDAQDARIEALIELQERQAKAAVPAPPKVEPPIEVNKNPDARHEEAVSPALAVMVVLASLLVGGVFRCFTKKKTG